VGSGNVEKSEKIDIKDIEECEKLFNDIVRMIGLDITVVYSPDPDAKDHGQYIPKEKLIILYDEDPDEAFKSLIHEVVEIRLYPLIKKYRLLVNTLIKYIDERLEYEKELTIERIVKDMLTIIEERSRSKRQERARSALDKFFEVEK